MLTQNDLQRYVIMKQEKREDFPPAPSAHFIPNSSRKERKGAKDAKEKKGGKN